MTNCMFVKMNELVKIKTGWATIHPKQQWHEGEKVHDSSSIQRNEILTWNQLSY